LGSEAADAHLPPRQQPASFRIPRRRTDERQEITMTRFTRIAAAALLGLGFAGTAFAADIGPRVVGSGENASVEYATPSANIVGGALTRTTGSGESARTEVLDVQNAQPRGGVARVVGTGNNASIVYGETATSRMAAGDLGLRG